MTEPKLEINSRCNSCDLCLSLCPENSIVKTDGNYYIDPWSCTLCGICQTVCPVEAVQEKLDR